MATADRTLALLPSQRPATVDDIVKRLASREYEWTAVTALGWGMGPAQLDIDAAVNAAEAFGFVTTKIERGNRFVQLAKKIRHVTAIGDARIFIYDEPTAHHPYAVDTYRLPTADETDPERTDAVDPKDLILVDAVGGYTPDDVEEMLDEAVAYLQQVGLVPTDSDPDMNEALRRVRATAAVTLPPLPAQPAARRRALAIRGW